MNWGWKCENWWWVSGPGTSPMPACQSKEFGGENTLTLGETVTMTKECEKLT